MKYRIKMRDVNERNLIKGDDQLCGARASPPSRPGRDPDDDRRLSNSLRILSRLWHAKGAPSGAGKSRHGDQDQRVGGGKERSGETGQEGWKIRKEKNRN